MASRTPNLLRLATFRHSLVAIPLNLIAGLSVVAFVYLSTQSIAMRRIDRDITAEQVRLMEDLADASSDVTAELIGERITLERGSVRLYLLLSQGHPRAANFTLDAPLLPPHAITTLRVTRVGGSDVMARLSVIHLNRGELLVVGRDLTEQVGFRLIVEETVMLAAGLTAFFAVLLGLIVSRSVLRRLSAINATVTGILYGQMDRRIPIAGGEDEFNTLAQNINAMLDRIDQSMAATREVTDNIAHDLRTPLNRIRVRLELALLPNTAGEEMEHAVMTALEEADMMSETFEALLTIARLDNGIPADFAPVDLPALADDLIDYFAPLAEEKDLTLRTGPLTPTVIMADRHLLFQAFSNAVDNAIRYTPAGGTVTVSIERTGGAPSFVVADDGPGIPVEKRTDVLRRFHRLDTSRNQPGTGLGLSVVEAVARHHQAQLLLEDNCPGLRLRLCFPADSVS